MLGLFTSNIVNKDDNKVVRLSFKQLDVWVRQVERDNQNIIQEAVRKAADYHNVDKSQIIISDR